MLEAISKVQVYFENDIHVDYDIEWFILTTLHVIHVYFVDLEMLDPMVYLENNILMDYDRE